MTGQRVLTSPRAALAALAIFVLAGVAYARQTTAPASVPSAAAPLPAPAAVSPAAQKPAINPASKAVTASKPVVPKPVDKPLWLQLSKPQQVALEPLAAEWDKMEGVRKQKWLDIANRFASMKPDEQQRVHERMRDWVKLTPDERRVARENYARTKKIEPAQKSAQWEQYQHLPEEQKKKLAAEAQVKKQVTNLPAASQTHVKPITPIKNNKLTPSASATMVTPAPLVTTPVPAPVATPAASVPAPAAASSPSSAPASPASVPPNAK